MAFGAILGAAASLAGGFLSKKGQSDANSAQAASVERQLAFQRESVQNSYQWAVKDMKRAGINPMLAYQQGGSSALSGANYTPQNEYGQAGDAIKSSVSSALAIRRQRQELRTMEAQEKLALSNEAVAQIEWYRRRDERNNINADTQNKYIQAQRQQQLLEIDKANVTSARTQATIARQDDEFYKSKYGKVLRWLDRTGTSLNPFANATGLKK